MRDGRDGRDECVVLSNDMEAGGVIGLSDLKALPTQEIARRPRHSHHVDELAFPGSFRLISPRLALSWRASVVTCRRRIAALNYLAKCRQ